jgi:serine/threonine-protein kinase SRPK3
MSGEDHELPNAPQYLVRPINGSKFTSKYLTGEACIIDFGESYEFSAPPKELGIPASYCSPEILFHEPAGPPSDIWALACTLAEIRSGQQLFQGMFGDEDDILMQMTQLFGKFPEPWWSAWEKRDCWYDEEGNVSTYLDDG